jgi:DegV family protein with EDD domain
MIEKWTKDLRLFVSVRTMKYLVRGGRVSAIKGLIARMLNINPIVTIDESGKATVFDKAFNQKTNMEKVMGHIRKLCQEKTIWNYIILHANNPEAAQWYSEKMEALTMKTPASVVNISPVIGVHAGIGAASVALLFD